MSRDRSWLGYVVAGLLAGCSTTTTASHPDPLFAMRYEKGVEAFDLDSNRTTNVARNRLLSGGLHLHRPDGFQLA